MFQTYEQIFRQRADAYQKAMELYPAARDREFQLAADPGQVKLAWPLRYIAAVKV